MDSLCLTPDQVQRMCQALANKHRQQIIHRLQLSDTGVAELQVVVGLSQSTLSHHLKLMVDAGLIQSWKRGRQITYRINAVGFRALMNFLDVLN